ncbi:MAG: tetratricopeptide repeat protein [Calditrichota bacterium]
MLNPSVRWKRYIPLLQLFLILSLSMFLASGCAYYNTLFNAKQSYNDGIKELEKAGGNAPGANKRQRGNNANPSRKYFETTIEKCWKLIEIYSDENKYADDALLYICKSEFHLQKYASAKTHLDQFLKKYPRSELIPEANLFYAKTLLRERNVEDANRLFREVLASSNDGSIRSQANLELGLYAFEEKNYQEAISHLEDALKEDISDEDRSRLHYNLGESYYIQKKYKEALKQYEEVEKYQPSVATDYQSRLKRAKTLAQLERFDDANKLLRKMLTAPRFQTFIPVIRNAIGENYQKQGLLDDAVETYKEIVQDRRSSPGTAQAAVNLARLYEFTFNDIDSAVTYYSKVKTLYSRYDSLETVQNKSRFLGEFKDIRDKISGDEKLISRLTYDESFRDSLYQAQFDDSVRLASGQKQPDFIPDPEDEEDEEDEDLLTSAFSDTSQTDPNNPFGRSDSLETQNNGDDRFASNDNNDRNSGFDRNNDRSDDRNSGFERNSDRRDDQDPDDPNQRDGEEDRGDDLGRGGNRDGLPDNSRNSRSSRDNEQRPKQKPLEKRKLPQIEFDFMNNRFALAEFYLLKVENIDSAAYYYEDFLRVYDDSVLTPKAVYSLMYINELEGYENPQRVDSLEQVLINEYPDSPFSREVLKARGLITEEDAKTKAEKAEKLFREAELLYFNGSVRQAFNRYSEIAVLDSTMEVAAKAQYARAWIFEYDFQQKDSSLSAYEKLIERYPSAREYVSMARAKTQPLVFAQETNTDNANEGKEGDDSDDGTSSGTGAIDFELAGEDVFQEKVAWRNNRESRNLR